MYTNALNALGFGCVALFNTPYTKVNHLLNSVLDSGINHFDTAPIYSKGYSEIILGNFLKGQRKNVTITTKFGLGVVKKSNLPASLASVLNSLKKQLLNKPNHKSFQPNLIHSILPYRQISKAEIEKSLGNSLRNLRTDYIDYYFLHEALPSFLDDDALTFLLQKKQEGTILHTGIATNSTNILTIKDIDSNMWDIIQYDSPVGLEKINPSKDYLNFRHFHHTVFHNQNIPNYVLGTKEIFGYQLAKAYQNNSNGKILFSTTNKKNLLNNIRSYLKYI